MTANKLVIKKTVTSEKELREFINSYDYTNVKDFACVDSNTNIVDDECGSLHHTLKDVINDSVHSYNTFYTTDTLDCHIMNDGVCMSVVLFGPMKPEFEVVPETYEYEE